MMVPVTMDAVKRRTRPRSHSAAGDVAELLAPLGSPTSAVNGRRLEREVHAALARLRAQSRQEARRVDLALEDRKSTRLNSSHMSISYAVFCLKKKKKNNEHSAIQAS